MNKELLQDLNAVYNGLNEDLDESKILLGNIIDKLEQVINYTSCSTQLPYTKTDLSRAYQSGCLENLDDCFKYSFKDLKGLQQESLKWVERYTK